MSAVLTAVGPAAITAYAAVQKDSRFSASNLGMYDYLSPEFFEPWIGAQFKATSPSQPEFVLKLIAVEPFAEQAAKSGLIPKGNAQPVSGFSIRFQGVGSAFPQNTYTLSNSGVGSFSALLVPSGKDAPSATYTATFAFAPE
jgi:hypothetical protein